MDRVSDQLIQCFNISVNTSELPKKLALKIKQKMEDNHTWIEKPQHGLLLQTHKGNNPVNESATHLWLKKISSSSYFEEYICAIQEEEILTSYLKTKRLTNGEINSKCRL